MCYASAGLRVRSDIPQEYIGVPKNNARLALYAFCDWIDVFHAPTFYGAWTEEVKKDG